jgi:hypothetical protein
MWGSAAPRLSWYIKFIVPFVSAASACCVHVAGRVACNRSRAAAGAACSAVVWHCGADPFQGRARTMLQIGAACALISCETLMRGSAAPGYFAVLKLWLSLCAQL